MVAEAQRSRAPIQRLADVVAGYFVPAVVAIAALAFIAWTIWGPAPALAHGLVAAVAVLILACPCAPRLAPPMSIQVGVGRGRSEEHTSEFQSLMRISYAVFCLNNKQHTLTRPSTLYALLYASNQK